EYRFNYFVDTLGFPGISALVTIALWVSIFTASGKSEVNGFSLSNYLSYAIWASFIGRIAVNYLYEIRMTSEITSGSLNNKLLRPMSFFEYYLFQFLGYKSINGIFSLLIPIAICKLFDLDFF